MEAQKSNSLEKLWDEMEIETRLETILKRENLRTLGDVSRLTHKDLIKIHGIGYKTLHEIESVLDDNGLELSRE
jgi:DNA-directed RNA polymerase alpha subunit